MDPRYRSFARATCLKATRRSPEADAVRRRPAKRGRLRSS